MKITIFSDNVAPYRIGWADEMGKTNDVTFVYTKDKDSIRNTSWLVKSSRFAKMVKLPAIVIKNRAITLNVIKYLRKNSSDIVIFDGYGPIPNMLGILYLKLKKKRYFINIDGIELNCKESKIKNFIKKMIFSKYAYFLCGSQYTVDWLKQFGVTEEKTIIHNFTSIFEKDILEKVPADYEREEAKLKLALKNKPTVLGVGRFIPYKQFDLLIKAFRGFDDKYQLVIIGEGIEKKNYEALISRYGLKNVLILDFMKFEDLKKYYLAADIFVLPATSEVWGLVVNEAMACGALPVITSDRCIAGFSLIKNGENGYRFSYENEDDLKDKIEEVIKNKVAMSEKSLEIIKDYTIENTARIHIEWFNKLLIK